MLSGWGRYPRAECRILEPRQLAEIPPLAGTETSMIARGNGRAYGDAALNPQATLRMLHNDRLIAFDETSGLVTCEAGMLLSDILDIFVPRGWFPPVTPGTKFVTIGGMIAADVHGKNHHKAGTFGNYVKSFDLLLASGSIVECSASYNTELFEATLGGMGLTGIILCASFTLQRIQTSYIRQETLRARNLRDIMEMFAVSYDWSYTAAWIDCLSQGDNLGRALLYRGEHAVLEDLPRAQQKEPYRQPRKRYLRVPFNFPSWALNRWSIRTFNDLYYSQHPTAKEIVDYDSFFYPLDAILEWNRIYGKKGFLQYQCVLPLAASYDGMQIILSKIAARKRGSFLAVLKLLGNERGSLSFPMKGYTLALDFPAAPDVFDLLNELDAVVLDHGGRIYLAKDARSTAATIQQGYPGIASFHDVRKQIDPHRKWVSLLSQRVGL